MTVKITSWETTRSYSVEGREAVKAPARHDGEVSWGGQLGWLQRHTVISAATMRTHNLPSQHQQRSAAASALAHEPSCFADILGVGSPSCQQWPQWSDLPYRAEHLDKSRAEGMGCRWRSSWRWGWLTGAGIWSSLARSRRGRKAEPLGRAGKTTCGGAPLRHAEECDPAQPEGTTRSLLKLILRQGEAPNPASQCARCKYLNHHWEGEIGCNLYQGRSGQLGESGSVAWGRIFGWDLRVEGGRCGVAISREKILRRMSVAAHATCQPTCGTIVGTPVWHCECWVHKRRPRE
jgi:hypothetical protein